MIKEVKKESMTPEIRMEGEWADTDMGLEKPEKGNRTK